MLEYQRRLPCAQVAQLHGAERLAAHLADFRVFQIEITKNYRVLEWRDLIPDRLRPVERALKDFLAECPLDGISVQGHVAHGTIYDEIMKAANALKCDLIVMASHRPELKDYLLGPNAARVVRHARQSVFVVRDAG